MKRNLVLCGFMGSGKTSTGRCLSALLNMPFVDLDVYIEKQQGKAVRALFAEQGETGFRTLERQAAQELGNRQNHIIACGGGTVLFEQNVLALQKNGLLVFLDITAETVYSRLGGDTTRPLLSGGTPQQTAALLAARRPAYLKAAALVVDANRRAEDVAAEIAAYWKQQA